MKSLLPIPDNKKLTITYRVEAGCLGPDGLNYIDDFCVFAQQELKMQESDYTLWNIIHRADKTLPEMEFSLMGKIVDDTKANKYFSVFNNTLDDFEMHLIDNLSILISKFMSKIPGSGH